MSPSSRRLRRKRIAFFNPHLVPRRGDIRIQKPAAWPEIGPRTLFITPVGIRMSESLKPDTWPVWGAPSFADARERRGFAFRVGRRPPVRRFRLDLSFFDPRWAMSSFFCRHRRFPDGPILLL